MAKIFDCYSRLWFW